MTLETTVYYDDLKLYFEKAKQLQAMNLASETGRDVHTQQVGDPLMDYVTIYDVVERRYAGFSNALQQVWWGSENPKKWQRVAGFDGARHEIATIEWMYLFLVHRITGSGASFAADHGFRNSIIPDLVKRRLTEGYVWNGLQDHVRELARSQPIFTSIGNQIPPFPKPVDGYDRGGEYYLHYWAPRLVTEMHRIIHDGFVEEGVPTIQTVAQSAFELQRSWGMRAFKFALTAWVMDLAEYFPDMVSPWGPCYYGANALEAMDHFAVKPRGMSPAAFYDELMAMACADMRTDDGEPSQPMSMEDVMCDYIRYAERFVPKGYDHLACWQIENRSISGHSDFHRSYTNHVCRVREQTALGQVPPVQSMPDGSPQGSRTEAV